MIKSTKKVSYRSTDSVGRPVPCISIMGKHLEQHGFNVGDETKIEYGAGFVHISRVIKNRYGPEPFGVTVR